MTKTKRTISIILLIAIFVSLFAIPALAAQKSITLKTTGNKLTYVDVKTGKGIGYFFGWKKTSVTVTNTGKYRMAVYGGPSGWDYRGEVAPGRSVSFDLSGNGRTYNIKIQSLAYTGAPSKYATASINTSAGSIS